jgi:hypothetical protein
MVLVGFMPEEVELAQEQAEALLPFAPGAAVLDASCLPGGAHLSVGEALARLAAGEVAQPQASTSAAAPAAPYAGRVALLVGCGAGGHARRSRTAGGEWGGWSGGAGCLALCRWRAVAAPPCPATYAAPAPRRPQLRGPTPRSVHARAGRARSRAPRG